MWLVGVMLVAGWRRWSAPPASELTKLPLPKLAPDSVVLEVTFIRIPEERVDFEARFWPEADEAALNAELRRRMAANGFRGGILGSPPPAALQELLDQQPVTDLGDGSTRIEAGTEIAVRTHRLRSRSGHPSKIIVRARPCRNSPPCCMTKPGASAASRSNRPSATTASRPTRKATGRSGSNWCRPSNTGKPGRGSRGNRARGRWTMSAGRPRPTTISRSNGAVTRSVRGDRLQRRASRTGRTVLCGRSRREQEPRLLLVVRLQQTQLDDRFMKEDVLEPITTTD